MCLRDDKVIYNHIASVHHRWLNQRSLIDRPLLVSPLSIGWVIPLLLLLPLPLPLYSYSHLLFRNQPQSSSFCIFAHWSSLILLSFHHSPLLFIHFYSISKSPPSLTIFFVKHFISWLVSLSCCISVHTFIILLFLFAIFDFRLIILRLLQIVVLCHDRHPHLGCDSGVFF